MICMKFKHHVNVVITLHMRPFTFVLEILIYYNYNSIDVYNQIAIEIFLHESSMAQSKQRLSLNTRGKSNLSQSEESNKSLSERESSPNND